MGTVHFDKAIRQAIARFASDRRGGMAFQIALVFSAIGLTLMLFGVPAMELASARFADARQPGIDRITTGSVQPVPRYTIRKSVLSDRPQFFCRTMISPACLPTAR